METASTIGTSIRGVGWSGERLRDTIGVVPSVMTADTDSEAVPLERCRLCLSKDSGGNLTASTIIPDDLSRATCCAPFVSVLANKWEPSGTLLGTGYLQVGHPRLCERGPHQTASALVRPRGELRGTCTSEHRRVYRWALGSVPRCLQKILLWLCTEGVAACSRILARMASSVFNGWACDVRLGRCPTHRRKNSPDRTNQSRLLHVQVRATHPRQTGGRP